MSILVLLQQTDLSILFFINQLANPIFDFIFSLPNLYPFWVPLIAFFFLRKKYRKLAALMMVTFVISIIAAGVVKDLVHRERPYQVLNVRQLVPEENNRSFPSNHAQLSFALSTIVFAFYRRLGIGLYIFSFIVAFGRIYAGVHYPTDIMGGAIIGVLIAILIMKIAASKKFSRTISLASQLVNLKDFLKYRKN